MTDTIFAQATARGKAGVAILRLSGPGSWEAVAQIGAILPEPRVASLRRLHDGKGELIDEALVLLFEEGRSFTGERVAELHLHGSHAVVSAVLSRLGEMPGLRHARPGEFTRRAFHNEVLDLTQVEGLADLIDAETQAQRRQAARVLSGAIARRAAEWRERLLRAMALVEAMIDFADEALPEGLLQQSAEELAPVIAQIRRELGGAKASERIRDGFEVAILGPPNAGKSTLLNVLAGRDVAITSEHAGTTRDVIEVRVEIDGQAVTLLDTAGLREVDDTVERIGVDRAKERAGRADLRVFLIPPGADMPGVEVMPDDLVVQAKGDLTSVAGLKVSGLTGEGVDELLRLIGSRLASRVAGAATITHARHVAGLRTAVTALEHAQQQIEAGHVIPELIAEDLRAAVHRLDLLVGRVDVEDVLGEIFASFCIGK